MALKMTQYDFKNTIDRLDKYSRYYTGFIDQHGHKSLHIWAEWKQKNKFDGEWEVNYDLKTGKFYNFTQVGG